MADRDAERPPKKRSVRWPDPPGHVDSDLLYFAVGEERKWLAEESLSSEDRQALLAELQSKLDTWRAELRPSRQDLLQFTTEENRMHVRFKRDTPELWERIEREWRQDQHPYAGTNISSRARDKEVERLRQHNEELPESLRFLQARDKDEAPDSNEGVDISKYVADFKSMVSEPSVLSIYSETSAPPWGSDTREAVKSSEDKRHTEWLWAATGVLVTILALVFWGFLFVLAWGLYAVGVYKAPWFLKNPEQIRFAKKGVIDAVIAFALLAVWWFVPIPEFAKPKAMPTPTPSATQTARESRTPTVIPTPLLPAVVTPAPSKSDMPTAVLKEIPFKEGSSQRLDLIMRAANYNGPTRMTVLWVRSSDTNEVDIIIGARPDLNDKNSWVLLPSDSLPLHGEDMTRVYVRSSKAAKLDITFKPQ